ncbi:uncharacterized protein EI97DRAFT_206472 [Westerdykella ornata]|uniref:Galactose oxidase n=1 Tax=Westerdykella ornata TaxID=318751 RepID=A0A6A6J7R5_WESOR|nr:uncharacterized protein EI97DRAFT_206472 [Westerdykella ornata]KAF2272591.1 hypothetical protein EI97DRAFT_206472 [Westerdykella ornata]
MGVPEPKYALSGHCSVIHNNTLYVYSPAGFQSLALEEGAEWEQLPMDISLTGALCVKAVPGGNKEAARLYIVGGSVNATAASWDYPGLMHYTFAEKKWDWVRPETFVTQNRQNHAAAYIDDIRSILVYSGSQITGDNGPSSQTFLISTEPPFKIKSSPSNDAPPAVRPLLLPWDEKSAVMLGGGPQNTAVFLFSSQGGWRNLGVTLTEPFTNQDTEQCTLVSGDDGSKVLERFDMGATPNRVSRIALLNQGGTIAAPGTTVGDKAKRLTISDWPAYNGTLAPTVTRAGFSIAQDDDGVAVITGGNPVDPLCIFDQRANEWVNATQLFAGDQLVIQSSPSSTVSTGTPTATEPPAASSSGVGAAAAAVPDRKARMLTVLGATLGAICGLAALLILFLLCLKRSKAKKRREIQSAYIEKDRLSFADRGAHFMSEAGGSVGRQFSASQTSLAIISGHPATNHKRGLGPLGSDASTAGLISKKSPLAYSEPVELSKFDLKPEPIGEEKIVRQNSGRNPPRGGAHTGRSRSSGWSKYFTNNEATNLAQPSNRSTFASERTSTGSQSNYTDSRMLSHMVPPLEIPKFENQRVSRVPTGSPTLGHSQENLPAEPMQAELGRANSNSSTGSRRSQGDYYHRAPVESWTPVGAQERPPSSTYTDSMVGDIHLRDGTSSYYPDGASSFYPKSNYSSFYPGQTPLHPPEGRESTVTVFPGGQPGGNGFASYPANSHGSGFNLPPRIGNPEDRESTVTVFPRGVPERPSNNAQQDMSWLNLGAGK